MQVGHIKWIKDWLEGVHVGQIWTNNKMIMLAVVIKVRDL